MVYALEANGTLAALNTFSTSGPDTLTEYPNINVPGATYMAYDLNLNRLYIPGGQEMEIVNVGQSPPQLLGTINIPAFTLPNNQNAIPATAAAVTDLPDGSRAYVSSYASITTQLNISSVSGDGTTATYAYTFVAGQSLQAGMTITVTGTGTGFDGTYIVTAVVSGTSACAGTCFQAPNTTTLASTPVSASGSGTNIFPQVTVVWTSSNTIKVSSIAIPPSPDVTIVDVPPGVPNPLYVPVCAGTRDMVGPSGSGFRFNMAPGGDSSRAYLSTCDSGVVDIINTSTDTYLLNQPEPASARPPIPPDTQNPPQNPVFLLAGP